MWFHLSPKKVLRQHGWKQIEYIWKIRALAEASKQSRYNCIPQPPPQPKTEPGIWTDTKSERKYYFWSQPCFVDLCTYMLCLLIPQKKVGDFTLQTGGLKPGVKEKWAIPARQVWAFPPYRPVWLHSADLPEARSRHKCTGSIVCCRCVQPRITWILQIQGWLMDP